MAAKRAILMQNCHGLSEKEPKFSFVRSNKVAAASKPTTVGRKPMKMLCTIGVFIYFINILLMSTINTNDGNTRAKVAVNEPSTANASPMPALCTAVYPQYVAELIPIGPGVICEIATILVNSAVESQ